MIVERLDSNGNEGLDLQKNVLIVATVIAQSQ